MALKLKKKGFKRVCIIDNGLAAMKQAGFVWVTPWGWKEVIGPDGKMQKIK